MGFIKYLRAGYSAAKKAKADDIAKKADEAKKAAEKAKRARELEDAYEKGKQSGMTEGVKKGKKQIKRKIAGKVAKTALLAGTGGAIYYEGKTGNISKAIKEAWRTRNAKVSNHKGAPLKATGKEKVGIKGALKGPGTAKEIVSKAKTISKKPTMANKSTVKTKKK